MVGCCNGLSPAALLENEDFTDDVAKLRLGVGADDTISMTTASKLGQAHRHHPLKILGIIDATVLVDLQPARTIVAWSCVLQILEK